LSSTVTILGATGSIGTSAIRVLQAERESFQVYGLTCRENLDILASQLEAVSPAAVAVESAAARSTARYRELKEKYTNIEFIEGSECVIELASREVDISISAIVGAAGLAPSMAALKAASRVALANKETLVMAGGLFMKGATDLGTELIPVDSEHSAIFSLLEHVDMSTVHKIIITASGGSLRDLPIDKLPYVTPDEALAHPTWSMGRKITIDSATLINKGLEVIEAHYLFSADYETIDVVVHPESIIHAMIETLDGAIYSHMGIADMAFPIQAALTWPEKKKSPFGRLDLVRAGSLSFQEVDHNRYPGLKLCYEAGRLGGTAPVVLNGANEIAVAAFLDKKISFTDIVPVVDKVLEGHNITGDPDLGTIFSADEEARSSAREIIRGIA